MSALSRKAVKSVNSKLRDADDLTTTELDSVTGALEFLFGAKFNTQDVEVRPGQVWAHQGKTSGKVEYSLVAERGDGKLAWIVLDRGDKAPFELVRGMYHTSDKIEEVIEKMKTTDYAYQLVAHNFSEFLAKVAGGWSFVPEKDKANE